METNPSLPSSACHCCTSAQPMALAAGLSLSQLLLCGAGRHGYKGNRPCRDSLCSWGHLSWCLGLEATCLVSEKGLQETCKVSASRVLSLLGWPPRSQCFPANLGSQLRCQIHKDRNLWCPALPLICSSTLHLCGGAVTCEETISVSPFPVTCRLLASRLFSWCSALAGSTGGKHGSPRALDAV